MTIEEYFEKQKELQSKMKVSKEDVWGNENDDGLIIAKSNQKCPIFNDVIPYKSSTLVCDSSIKDEVIYWLDYVLGGGSVSKTKEFEDGKIAIRADYQCW